jgi:sigma-B regulation protein RsbU (phosphoserine phosphatase)
VLWRVRHRLLVTWVLVGVVPLVLICALFAEGFFILMGQAAAYMTANEIARQSELIRSRAEALVWALDHRAVSVTVPMLTEAFLRENFEPQSGKAGVVVRNGKDVSFASVDGEIRAIPEWSKRGFAGLVADKENLYLAAHAALGNSPGQAEIFLYRHTPAGFFQNLLPNVANIVMVGGRVTAGGINIERKETKEPRSGISFKTPQESASDPDMDELPRPSAKGWWDIPVSWIVLTKNVDLATGKSDNSLAIVSSRPSRIVGQLFSTLGSAASGVFVLMAVTAVALFMVEIISALFGAKLTRSITRAVGDLYEGTRKVHGGDFSHRIPVRKNKDQLSELAVSFNTMTAHIEELIVEVKEKERLENELEIAREVQAQLFPKQLPRLKTLEVFGACQPARSVSGDYYDFLPLGSDRLALAIGDISGKGISAALLMAHIQSALRTQFMQRNNRGEGVNGVTSPSNIISILNDHLYTSSPPEKYATFFLGLYGDEGGQLIYTNAGHLAPVIVRRGEILKLPGDGLPVGMFPAIQYDQQNVSLEPGDLLLAFTDGVTETPNKDGEQFGDQRLADIVTHQSELSLDRIADVIIASVGAWAGDVERHDDTTLLLARRL